MTLTLYFAPGSSAMAPHIALHEIGVPFEGRAISFAWRAAWPALALVLHGDNIDINGSRAVAQLLVRNVAEELVAKLRVRAALHGRSAEAEHREILRQALSEEPRPSFKEVAAGSAR
jgi:plasmid stability protein